MLAALRGARAQLAGHVVVRREEVEAQEEKEGLLEEGGKEGCTTRWEGEGQGGAEQRGGEKPCLRGGGGRPAPVEVTTLWEVVQSRHLVRSLWVPYTMVSISWALLTPVLPVLGKSFGAPDSLVGAVPPPGPSRTGGRGGFADGARRLTATRPARRRHNCLQGAGHHAVQRAQRHAHPARGLPQCLHHSRRCVLRGQPAGRHVLP